MTGTEEGLRADGLAAEFRPLVTAELAAARATERRLAASMKDVSDARDGANVDDEHDPEGATIAFERGQLDGIRRGTLLRIAALEAALARLDAGTFGLCGVDGMPVPADRLRAVPEATTCVAHA